MGINVGYEPVGAIGWAGQAGGYGDYQKWLQQFQLEQAKAQAEIAHQQALTDSINQQNLQDKLASGVGLSHSEMKAAGMDTSRIRNRADWLQGGGEDVADFEDLYTPGGYGGMINPNTRAGQAELNRQFKAQQQQDQQDFTAQEHQDLRNFRDEQATKQWERSVEQSTLKTLQSMRDSQAKQEDQWNNAQMHGYTAEWTPEQEQKRQDVQRDIDALESDDSAYKPSERASKLQDLYRKKAAIRPTMKRMNVWGDRYTDEEGNVWQDNPYTGESHLKKPYKEPKKEKPEITIQNKIAARKAALAELEAEQPGKPHSKAAIEQRANEMLGITAEFKAHELTPADRSVYGMTGSAATPPPAQTLTPQEAELWKRLAPPGAEVPTPTPAPEPPAAPREVQPEVVQDQSVRPPAMPITAQDIAVARSKPRFGPMVEFLMGHGMTQQQAELQAARRLLSSEAPTEAGAPGPQGPVIASNAKTYATIPSGTRYQAPNGRFYIKR